MDEPDCYFMLICETISKSYGDCKLPHNSLYVFTVDNTYPGKFYNFIPLIKKDFIFIYLFFNFEAYSIIVSSLILIFFLKIYLYFSRLNLKETLSVLINLHNILYLTHI